MVDTSGDYFTNARSRQIRLTTPTEDRCGRTHEGITRRVNVQNTKEVQKSRRRPDSKYAVIDSPTQQGLLLGGSHVPAIGPWTIPISL